MLHKYLYLFIMLNLKQYLLKTSNISNWFSLSTSVSDMYAQFQSDFAQNILRWLQCKFIQMKDHILFQGGGGGLNLLLTNLHYI